MDIKTFKYILYLGLNEPKIRIKMLKKTYKILKSDLLFYILYDSKQAKSQS